MPYGVGTLQGKLLQEQRSVYRSGLLDFTARLSVNLYGGAAMPAQKFARTVEKSFDSRRLHQN
jgi:hypothetical protein